MSSVPARLIPVTMIITVGNLSFLRQGGCGFVSLRRAFTASRVISQDLRSFHIKMVVRWRQSGCSFQWEMFFQISLQKTAALLGAYQICMCVCVCVRARACMCVCVQACVYCRLTKEHLQSLLFSIFSFFPLLSPRKFGRKRCIWTEVDIQRHTHTYTHMPTKKASVRNNSW